MIFAEEYMFLILSNPTGHIMTPQGDLSIPLDDPNLHAENHCPR